MIYSHVLGLFGMLGRKYDYVDMREDCTRSRKKNE